MKKLLVNIALTIYEMVELVLLPGYLIVGMPFWIMDDVKQHIMDVRKFGKPRIRVRSRIVDFFYYIAGVLEPIEDIIEIWKS